MLWAALGCLIPAFGQRFNVDQLPAPVQKTISQRKGPDRVKSVEFQARNGISAYVVEFARRGFNPKLVVAPDGTVIEDHRVRVPMANEAENLKWDLPEPGAAAVKLREVPAAVRNRITRESRGRAVERIKTKPYGEQKLFVVEFKQPGRNERVYILDNGSLLAQQTAVAQGATGPMQR